MPWRRIARISLSSGWARSCRSCPSVVSTSSNGSRAAAAWQIGKNRTRVSCENKRRREKWRPVQTRGSFNNSMISLSLSPGETTLFETARWRGSRAECDRQPRLNRMKSRVFSGWKLGILLRGDRVSSAGRTRFQIVFLCLRRGRNRFFSRSGNSIWRNPGAALVNTARRNAKTRNNSLWTQTYYVRLAETQARIERILTQRIRKELS